MSEIEALRRYADHRDAEAFRDLVLRYQRLVYAACRRHLSDPADIEDATQETFLKLARAAGEIRGGLVSWLHKAAVTTSLDLLRGDRRRRQRETAAARPEGQASPSDPAWAEISRELDAALQELDEADRELILRHFYEGEPQTALAADRGVSQPTVSRHIGAAVDRLRGLLAKRGVTAAAGTLATLVATDAAKAHVPAALTAGLTKIGLVGAGGSAAAAAMSLPVKIAATVALAAVVGGGGYLAVTSSAGGSSPAAQTVAVAAPPAAVAGPVPTEMRGTWRLTPAGPDPFTLTFTADRLTIEEIDGNDGRTENRVELSVVRVDPTATPAEIDLRVERTFFDDDREDGGPVGEIGRIVPAVYELAGDRLRFALPHEDTPEQRPTNFDDLQFERIEPPHDAMGTLTQRGRHVHRSAVDWAEARENWLPQDLLELLNVDEVAIEELLSPGATAPPDFPDWEPAERERWARQNVAWIWLPGLRSTLDTQEIAMVLKPEHAIEGQIAMVFQDNHVAWMAREAAERAVRLQTGRALSELVQLAEAGKLTAESIQHNVVRE